MSNSLRARDFSWIGRESFNKLPVSRKIEILEECIRNREAYTNPTIRHAMVNSTLHKEHVKELETLRNQEVSS